MANGRYNLSDNIDFKIRKVIKSLKSSPIRNVANSVIGKKNIIPLYFGETDIATPAFISKAMKTALDDGHTFYSANQGISELVETISKYSSSLHKKKNKFIENNGYLSWNECINDSC